MEYYTFSYIKQYEKIKEKYPEREGLSGNEYLSYMKRNDKLTPIITVVIHYGDEEWDAAKSLYEMMDIPEELKLEKEDIDMWDLFKEIERDGEIRGEARGEAKGEFNGRIKEIIALAKEIDMDEEAIIKRIQERMKLDATKSREYYDMFNE